MYMEQAHITLLLLL